MFLFQSQFWQKQPIFSFKYSANDVSGLRLKPFNQNGGIKGMKSERNSRLKLFQRLDHVIYSPQTAAGGNKREGSNTIMSTLFALVFWSYKIIDVDTILSITLTIS